MTFLSLFTVKVTANLGSVCIPPLTVYSRTPIESNYLPVFFAASTTVLILFNPHSSSVIASSCTNELLRLLPLIPLVLAVLLLLALLPDGALLPLAPVVFMAEVKEGAGGGAAVVRLR